MEAICSPIEIPHYLDNRLTDVGEFICLTHRPRSIYIYGTYFVKSLSKSSEGGIIE
jgi:hypothetical protein